MTRKTRIPPGTKNGARPGGLGLAISMVPMMVAGNHAFYIFAHNIVWGGFAGAYITTNNLIWPNYFGRRFLGTIRGVALPVIISATGLGPPLYGFLLDSDIPTAYVWTLSLICFVTAGIILFITRPPQYRRNPVPEAERAT